MAHDEFMLTASCMHETSVRSVNGSVTLTDLTDVFTAHVPRDELLVTLVPTYERATCPLPG
jgi:hypothetical protein